LRNLKKQLVIEEAKPIVPPKTTTATKKAKNLVAPSKPTKKKVTQAKKVKTNKQTVVKQVAPKKVVINKQVGQANKIGNKLKPHEKTNAATKPVTPNKLASFNSVQKNNNNNNQSYSFLLFQQFQQFLQFQQIQPQQFQQFQQFQPFDFSDHLNLELFCASTELFMVEEIEQKLSELLKKIIVYI
jgi:hypothetical protein